jgi:hypothetical protein
MHRVRHAALAATMLALVAVPAASAAPPALHGVLSNSARIGGHSMAEFAGDFDAWTLQAADVNPALNPRCDQSPLDPHVWYLPVSFGPVNEVWCEIPQGSFLLLMTGGAECSDQEAGTIWYGGNEAELRDCVDTDVQLITYTSATIDGQFSDQLSNHVVRSGVVNVPAPSLFGDSPAISMFEGYFLMIAPLTPGEHTLAGWAEFESLEFAGGVTYHLTID